MLQATVVAANLFDAKIKIGELPTNIHSHDHSNSPSRALKIKF